MGSNVIARQGDITLIGKEVNIGAALDTTQQKEFHEIKQTGLTLTASNPMVSAVQTGVRMADAAGKTDNAVMKGLAGATTGLAAVNAYDAVQASAKAAAAAELAKPGSSNEIDKVGGVSIKLSLGTSKSSSTTDRNSSSAFGSTVSAGKDLTIVAQGAGKDSDITVTGSNLSAGSNVVLKAEGDIVLQAARNAFEQKTDSKSSSASIGIGYSTGGQQNGWTLELGASVGRGNANGRDESWTNSNITAGNVLAMQSGGDTTLKGAGGRADQIIASVGGNLLLESLQDSSKYDSKNKSAGFGLSLCIPPYCMGSSSASANASTGKMSSDFKSVTEQTGLWAGDGGFLIDVKNNTTLIGSVIASSDRAVADGLNKLTTGTLVTEDLKNTAKYSGSQVSIGGGFGFGGDAKAGDSGLGTTKGGQVAGGATKDAGSSISTGSSGFGMGTPVVVAASGNSSSTTQSGISGGTIVIRDEAGQLALTGKTAAETIGSLNRDTTDTLNALKPIFDKEKIEAGFEIASEAQRQMGQFLTNRAKEADKVKGQLAAELDKGDQADPDRLRMLNAEFAKTRTWAPGGNARNAMTVVVAAASGNVTGSTSDFAMNAALGYLQTQGSQLVKDWADSLPQGVQSESVRAALHGLLACGSAAAQGSACSSAAAGAGLSSVLGYLLATSMGGSEEEIEVKNNLLNGLIASIVGGLGGEAATASAAASIESENNSFYRNRAAVAEATGKERAALEQQLIAGNLSPEAYEQGLRTLDASSSKIDALLTIYNIQSGSALSEQLGRMSDVHAAMFAEAVTGLLTFPGMVTSAYELATGETVASHEEANYFFAALGIIPGAKLGKAVDQIGDLARTLKDAPAVAAAKQIAANQAKGNSFEGAVLGYLSRPKNTASFAVNVNGRLITVIPDATKDAARILEIKDVAKLSNSAQFRAYAALVKEGGTVTKGLGSGNGVFKQFEGIDLIVSPNTKISGPLQRLIARNRGSIRVFDIKTKELTPWIPK
jgi:filamentous hemagglutinin